MKLQDESWQEVIQNKPDWANFITRDPNGFFEYHEEQPLLSGFGKSWISKGVNEGYYEFDTECLDLSTIASVPN